MNVGSFPDGFSQVSCWKQHIQLNISEAIDWHGAAIPMNTNTGSLHSFGIGPIINILKKHMQGLR